VGLSIQRSIQIEFTGKTATTTITAPHAVYPKYHSKKGNIPQYAAQPQLYPLAFADENQLDFRTAKYRWDYMSFS
jgi:hypothetical protein